MNSTLKELLDELEEFGHANDDLMRDRPGRMLNITRDTGDFLSVLIKIMSAKRILEIGTSNGYSTLWLADASRTFDGKVTTVEMSAFKIAMAAKNFVRAGLADHITQIEGDAGAVLSGAADAAFDMIFLDSDRSEYGGWWPDLKRVLRRGGLLVVDNATSHAKEMALFINIIQADGDFVTSLVPVGKGEFLATKEK
ncbi:O-methyltransferase [Glaciimonas sp. Gout2]|uniref:O-methyltransferase n=1 Tax=unclassified Glaciimonas TaxID=2644401 RepID=UPI002AB5ACFB|nr:MULTISPECIES: O-methyltransferase [unclassified Glaciimonas]MDY7548637.1 O-methyltransferase [Glaciimonas sp. CA11.2]MEB0014022.1 O-methyltransferase [Glaciimonas sp. Cout2]MEB0084196.1 O-methyltransferase [Glaciimonas sp. Gout2]